MGARASRFRGDRESHYSRARDEPVERAERMTSPPASGNPPLLAGHVAQAIDRRTEQAGAGGTADRACFPPPRIGGIDRKVHVNHPVFGDAIIARNRGTESNRGLTTVIIEKYRERAGCRTFRRP